MTKIAVIFAGLSLLAGIPCSAAIITVDPNGSADYTTIQAAINDANDGYIVLVADGTYMGDGNRDIDFLGKAITVKSANGPQNCIINCHENGRGFYFGNGEGPDSILSGITIANGCSGYGGGIYISGSSPTIRNCTFTRNQAADGGGGICNTGGSPTVTNCAFIGNYSVGDYTSKGSGAGMYNGGGSPTIINCTFSGNYADCGDGGGMYNSGSSPTIINCTFTGNWCCRYDDEIYGYGGGMYNWESNVTVTNCIFWDNWAWHWSYNDIVAFRSSITVSYSCVKGGWSGEGNIDADPLFIDADGPDNIVGTEDDNLRLSAGSPCIDAGDSNSVTADTIDLDSDGDPNEPIPWDLDGHNRFVDDPCTADTGVGTLPIVDMGAYERGICGNADHPYPVGDVNIDCVVDLVDFAICALAWLTEDGQAGWNPDCNLYDDFVIDTSDLRILGAHWLECTKPECD